MSFRPPRTRNVPVGAAAAAPGAGALLAALCLRCWVCFCSGGAEEEGEIRVSFKSSGVFLLCNLSRRGEGPAEALSSGRTVGSSAAFPGLRVPKLRAPSRAPSRYCSSFADNVLALAVLLAVRQRLD